MRKETENIDGILFKMNMQIKMPRYRSKSNAKKVSNGNVWEMNSVHMK